ncbi:hypothetical protein ACFVV7_36065 [Streptomyces globisporus]|uniref:hypothetical protein n=1 Tax=Streptomyces globisporus TaxID=1908 RepID=UPI0036DA78CA
MAALMTRLGKRRDWCCTGHSLKSLDHGTERAREHRDWRREIAREFADEEDPRLVPCPAATAEPC